MAENKKSFVLYSDLLSVVKKLVLQDRQNKTNYGGELFLHILEYVNDENPIPIDFIIEMAFEPIKMQLKRDLKKYELIKEKRSLAGKKSAELRQQVSTHVDFVENNSTQFNKAQQASTNSTVNDNDSVNVNDNDNVFHISKSHCDFSKSQTEEIEKPIPLNSEEKVKRKKVPPKKEKVPPKKEKEVDHWKSIVDMWFNFYKSKFPISPTFNATEGKHLKSIITKFQTLAKEKDKNESIEHVWTEDRVLRMFEKFLNQAWIDKWLSENFLLKNLNSNFDAIITKKNNTNGTKQPISGTTKKQFDFNPQRIIETHVSKTE